MTERSVFRLVVRSVGFLLLVVGVFAGVGTLASRMLALSEWKYLSDDVIFYKISTPLICLTFGIALLLGSGLIVRLIYGRDEP